jgi:hypothetical protein
MKLLTSASTTAQPGGNPIYAVEVVLLELVVLDLFVRETNRVLPMVALTTLEPS